MILYNTTFHVDEKAECDFVAWLKTDYIPRAEHEGLINPMLARLVNNVEPGCATYALHFDAASMPDVERWENGVRNELTAEIFSRWQYGVLAFSTAMERIGI